MTEQERPDPVAIESIKAGLEDYAERLDDIHGARVVNFALLAFTMRRLIELEGPHVAIAKMLATADCVQQGTEVVMRRLSN